MKKIVRLTESDLTRLLKRVINEMEDDELNSGKDWYEQMREYEEYMDDLLGKKSPKGLNRKDGPMDSERRNKLISIAYFDSIDRDEEEKILKKIQKIGKHLEKGKDPGWTTPLISKLMKLKRHMNDEYRESYRDDLYKYFNYNLKK